MGKKANREPLNRTIRSFLENCRLKAALNLLSALASWICGSLSFNLSANLTTGISRKNGFEVFKLTYPAYPITIPLDNTLVSVHKYLVAGIFPVH